MENDKSEGCGGAEESEKIEQHSELRSDLGNQLPARLRFKQRMRHFTWTWFTMTMATGGIANVLYVLPP
jgi:hypothetical protein